MPEQAITARVSARHLRREQVQVDFRMRSLLIDHPPELDGEDEGPTPGELILAGLAASAAQHVGRYAARLGIPLRGVEIKTNFEVGQEKTGGPLDPASFLSKVLWHVEIRGDMTPEQFETLKFIAEHCVGANTLRKSIPLAGEVVHVKA